MQNTLTITEAAARLGRKPWDIQRMIDSGQLTASVVVDEAAVDALLAGADA